MSAFSRIVRPAGAPQPLDAIASLWRGRVREVLQDGSVWVVIPRLSGDEPMGPMPTTVAGLITGEPVIVAAMEDSRNDLLIVSRLADGQVVLPGRFSYVQIDDAPTAPGHATRKDYVDTRVATRAALVHSHSNATALAAGFMSQADKVKLDAATASGTAGAIVQRNTLGRADFNQVIATAPAPTDVSHVTRKDYVDGLVGGRAPVSHRHTYGDIDGLVPTSALPPLAVNDVFTVSSQAAMLALVAERGDMAIRTDTGRSYALSADTPGLLSAWKELMATGQVVSVAGKTGVVLLTPGDVGLSNVNNTSDANKPISSAVEAALNNKSDASHTHSWGQITGKPTTFTPSSHSHSGADITSGTISDARIANATSALDGLLNKADKAKLDKATYDTPPNTLVQTNASGYIKAAALFVSEGATQPTQAHALTRKDYVDGQVGTRALSNHSHSASDVTSGILSNDRLKNTTGGDTWMSIATSSGAIRIATNGNFYAQSDDGNGTMRTDVAVQSDGNLTTRAANPVRSNDLTRKDYVDSMVAGAATKIWSTSITRTGGLDAGASVSVVVPIPAGTFSVTPHVVATPNNDAIDISIPSRSATSITVKATNNTTRSSGLAWLACIIAVQT